MNFQHILNQLAGNERHFAMEHRIFNCAIAYSLATLIPAFFYMLTQNNWAITGILLVYIGLYSFIYKQ